jgi:hypothetical protein
MHTAFEKILQHNYLKNIHFLPYQANRPRSLLTHKEHYVQDTVYE